MVDRGDRLRSADAGSIYERTPARSATTSTAICATRDAAGPRGRRRARAASLRRASGTRSARRPRRRRSRPTTRQTHGAAPGRQRQGRHRVGGRATSPRSARSLPGPDGSPLRSYVTGQAGFDADRSAAVEGIDGTLLAITGVLVLVLMLLDLPLAADRRR